MYTYSHQTSAGRVRKNNEDAVVLDGRLGLVVLADGMGGHQAGEVASGMATQLIMAELVKGLGVAGVLPATADIRRTLARCVADANRAIFSAGLVRPECRGMGTTLVLAVFGPETLVLGHVGDSRCYRLRHGQLVQLTKDHSVLQEEIDAGLMTPEQALIAPHKNLLTRALGVAPAVVLDVVDLAVQPGDVYLLCSDGLSDMVRDAQLKTLLQQDLELQDKADQLVKMANDQGGLDNISVALIQATAQPQLQPVRLLARLLGK